MPDHANWRHLLPQLEGLPLLPCGSVRQGDGGKAPIDPATGRGLQGWPTAAFSPEQIAALNGVVRCIGSRTGPDADGLIVFDLDGRSAIEHCIAQGCDPDDGETWIIGRTTAIDRFKVCFRVPIELWGLLGQIHVVRKTRPATETEKGEQVEVFFGSGQIIVLGEHIDTGGHYIWDGSPDDIAEIPPEWWGLALSILEGDPKSARNGKPSDTAAGWRTISNCPICGRNQHIACRSNAERDTVLCFHGGTFHPPTGLSKGEVITGRDNQRWAFCGTGRHHGDFSTFRLDRPRELVSATSITPPPGALPPSKPAKATKATSKATKAAPAALDPNPFTKRLDTEVRWGEVPLSLSRRINAFNRCIAASVGRERNSLRRIAQVRQAHLALKLKTAINQKEIGQLILEHLDERTGNIFQALSATDRQSMPMPTVEWLVPNCIPLRDLTIIGGRAKVGKTRLANALLSALLAGGDFLDFGTAQNVTKAILVSDDQGDGDTAQMLHQLQLWNHPELLWSRRFRVTEANLDRLLATIAANPGAVVILDSLRSITRSMAFGENDPEMGGLIYDLKQQIVDAGSTLVLIHHCNKSNDATGTEALSGHNAIAGAANTIITLHYLAKGQRLLKDSAERRLVREARSGPPADLVVALQGETGQFRRVGEFEAYQEQQEGQGEKAHGVQLETAIRKEPADTQAALRFLHAHHKAGSTNPPGLMDICKQIGVAPEAARRVGELVGAQATAYKRVGKTLGGRFESIVSTQRITTPGGGFYVAYQLTDEGAEMVGEIFSL